MLGFKPRISGVRSNCSANCASTIAPKSQHNLCPCEATVQSLNSMKVSSKIQAQVSKEKTKSYELPIRQALLARAKLAEFLLFRWLDNDSFVLTRR